jgi:hypothetical protein
LPGTYKLRLTVNGETHTASLIVKQDPRVDVLPSDLTDQLTLALTVRDQLTRLVNQVEAMRMIRQQLAQQGDILKAQPRHDNLVKLGKDLIARLDKLEDKLHLTKADIPNDVLRLGGRLYDQLSTLYFAILRGDGAPTQGMREMHDEHSRALKEVGATLQRLIAEDLAQFNQLARSLDVPAVIVPEKPTR